MPPNIAFATSGTLRRIATTRWSFLRTAAAE